VPGLVVTAGGAIGGANALAGLPQERLHGCRPRLNGWGAMARTEAEANKVVQDLANPEPT